MQTSTSYGLLPVRRSYLTRKGSPLPGWRRALGRGPGGGLVPSGVLVAGGVLVPGGHRSGPTEAAAETRSGPTEAAAETAGSNPAASTKS